MPPITISLSPLEAAVVAEEVARAQDGRTDSKHVELLVQKVLAPRVEQFQIRQSKSLTSATDNLDEVTKGEFAAALSLPDPKQRAQALQVAVDRYKVRVK